METHCERSEMSGTCSGGNFKAFSEYAHRSPQPPLSLNTALVFGTKKNLFDKKRNVQASHSYLPETFSVGVGTFPEGGLPWFQRACPSTTLDKNYVFNCRPEFIGLRDTCQAFCPRRSNPGGLRVGKHGRLVVVARSRALIPIGTDCSRFRPRRPNGNGAKHDEVPGQAKGQP